MGMIDISPEISEKTAIFPGDVPFSRRVNMDFSHGDHLGLSSIQTSVHIGAHADAPNHYAKGGVGIDKCPLETYFGSCQVIQVDIPKNRRIVSGDIDVSKVTQSRVLFKTGSFPDPNNWSYDFNSLCPSLIAVLAEKGVILVGIDTPSIDPWDSKDLESHKEVAINKMAILEGIVLNHVVSGLYTLMALPLKIKNGDASPVRAVLLDDDQV